MRYLVLALLALALPACVSSQVTQATKNSHGLEAAAESDLYNAAVESASGIVDPVAKITVLLALRERHQRFVSLHANTAAGIDAPPVITTEQLAPLTDIVKQALSKQNGGP
jgi:hypothetical protein